MRKDSVPFLCNLPSLQTPPNALTVDVPMCYSVGERDVVKWGGGALL